MYQPKRKEEVCLAGVQAGMLRITLPRVSFSPESGGKVKPNRAMLDISTQGTIRLKK